MTLVVKPTIYDEPTPNPHAVMLPEPMITLSDTPFNRTLMSLAEIHERKNHDYADVDDKWSNFRIAGEQVRQSIPTVIEVMIATKQARLSELMYTSKEPKNESIADTMLDRAVYSVLALLYLREQLDER